MNPEVRTLTVGALTRVEGEGALNVTLTDGVVDTVELNIYEPPRFFEAFLPGRSYTEPPDITARVCGICPVAYQISACNAIEDACGVTVPPELVALRRLLYFGEWIHSHALHIFLLHAPDFLGYPDAISLAKDRREFVEKGLALKKAGNRLMEQLGGRAIHPINVRLGGFYSVPSAADLESTAEMLRHALDDALYTVRAVAEFDITNYWR
jgi:coenzyme F420-reducing hydrogenase alpha subunit